jgi:hypothetical protein
MQHKNDPQGSGTPAGLFDCYMRDFFLTINYLIFTTLKLSKPP